MGTKEVRWIRNDVFLIRETGKIRVSIDISKKKFGREERKKTGLFINVLSSALLSLQDDAMELSRTSSPLVRSFLVLITTFLICLLLLLN